MRKILILMGRYLPGYKDGGPIRTISHLVEMLGDEYAFFIACLDRDHGDVTPYPGVRPGSWQAVGKAKVWYVAPGGFTEGQILKLAEGMDLIYLCSFYDDYGRRTLNLKHRGELQIPVVLASMGVFSEGALKQHALKKRLYIAACKRTGLFNDICWSVSSEREAQELQKIIGRDAVYVVAEDPPGTRVPGRPGVQDVHSHEVPGKRTITSTESQKTPPLRIVFLSRISPKKNLLGAIEALREVRHAFEFTIYGPCEDKHYWRKCQARLKRCPFSWVYAGEVAPDKVQDVLAAQDVFLFPSLGENYGHVIFEALSAGCIPIISDRTPWAEIQERHAGYMLPPEDLRAFGRKINDIIELPREARAEMAEAGVEIARARIEKNKAHSGYREIFG